jgi:hypothetical protein
MARRLCHHVSVSTVALVTLGVAWLVAAPLGAQGAPWTTRGGDVRVRCPLTIGGSFEAKTRMLSGSVRPGPASTDPWLGEFVVELSDLDTGIDLRTQHMREAYLEVGKGPQFSRAVLTEIRLPGIVAAMPVGRSAFSARLRLHGMERQVTGQAELRRSGPGVHVRASFPVVLEEFGIAKPRYLGIGVKDEVTVQVTFEMTPEENAR